MKKATMFNKKSSSTPNESVEFDPISASSPNSKTDKSQIDKFNTNAINPPSPQNKFLNDHLENISSNNSESSLEISGFTEEFNKLGPNWPDSLDENCSCFNDLNTKSIDESTAATVGDKGFSLECQKKFPS